MDPLLAGDRAPAPRTPPRRARRRHVAPPRRPGARRHPPGPDLRGAHRAGTAPGRRAGGSGRMPWGPGGRAGPLGDRRPLRRRSRHPARRGGLRARRRRRPPGAGRPRLLGGRGDGRGGAAPTGHGAGDRPGVAAHRLSIAPARPAAGERGRRRVGHLHVGLDRRAQGRGGLAPVGRSVRRRRGPDVLAGQSDRTG